MPAHSRLTSVLSVLVCIFALVPDSSAAIDIEKAQKPIHGLVRTALKGGQVSGGMTTGTLERPVIKLVLPNGRQVVARRTHVARQPKVDATTWRGTVAGACSGTLTVTSARGVLSGFLILCDATYEVRAAGNSLRFYSISGEAFQEECLPRPPPVGSAQTKPDGATYVSADLVPVIQDVLILTTAAARAVYGPVLDAWILNDVAAANDVYRDGGVGIALNVVAIADSSMPEGASNSADLYAISYDAEANALRNSTGADLVLLIRSGGGGGIAWVMGGLNSAYSTLAYGVVSADTFPSRVLAHEVGHIQGLAHDHETVVLRNHSTGATDYGYGYRVCRTDDTGVYDIMAYPCTAGYASLVYRFSDPYHYVNGYAFGVAYEVDPANAADGVRGLNASAAIVAAYRSPVAVAPLGPVSFVVLDTTLSGVTIGWSDYATSEDGYAVERSSDGISWSEIARTGAGATSFLDSTVAQGATYSYRARAFNSAGYSSYSAVASVTTFLSDSTPDAFAFAELSNVALSTAMVSDPVTLSGINVGAPVSIVGGQYSIGCMGAFTGEPGVAYDGQRVCVRHTSAATYSTPTSTTFTVGGVWSAFTSTTLPEPPDSAPDSFNFPPLANVEPRTPQTSAAAIIAGINFPVTVRVSGGEYSIGCAVNFTAADGKITNGQTICVRHTSAAGYSSSVSTTLYVGDGLARFDTTTRSAPATSGGGSMSLGSLALGLVALAARRRRRRESDHALVINLPIE